MLIENPEVFKSWLTSILEPLCDADPAALAKYVYALVKKDKPVEELREVMVDQLDVFLQQETKPFVAMLFKALETQEHLKHEVESEPQPPAAEEPPKETEPLVENNVATIPAPTTSASTTSAAPTSVGGLSGPRSGGESRGRSPTAGAIAGAPAPPRVVLNRAARVAAPAPLNRHPHNEHTLVKVLPLSELLDEPVDQPPRRRDRRGDLIRDKDDRRRRRSRSWERRARARRHGRDNEHTNDIRRRLSSRSPSPRGRYRNRSPPIPALDRQTSRSRSRSPVLRDREHERDRLRVPRELERDRMSRDREHRDRVSRDRERSRERSRDRSTSPRDTDRRLDHNDIYKRRCRDFDEKGYCMRGDLCQWDHGSDPVVLEDAAAALSTVLALPPQVPEYNPLTPDIWCGGGGSFPPYAHPHPLHAHPPRELIPIPSLPHRPRHELQASGPRASGPGGVPRHPAPHKKNFDYTRFGPRPSIPSNAVNCSLDVKKVPRGMNDITHLNNHFSKFGKIVNIQVCYEGDPEAALITFSNPTEANIAYKSTEAVLNNRFIKVFWHTQHNNTEVNNKQENMAPAGQPLSKPTERSNSQHPMSHNKVLINRDNIKATADIKMQQDKEKEVENSSEPRKEAPKPAAKNKMILDQHKRAQALLETQLQQQMLLIQKLESGNVTEAQRPALLQAISSAQEGIEKLRKHLLAYNDTVKQMQQAKKPKTMEEAQKEILDAELDLFNKQQEGQDVAELQLKIAELRRQMSIQFPTHIMRRPAGRGGRFNTATRFTRGGLTRPPRSHNLTVNKVFNQSMNQSVDHRPRALLISGFEVDELEALLAHFSQYGEVVSKEEELSVPQLVLQYKSRAHAELAAVNGKHYNDRTLSITWVANPTGTRMNPPAIEPKSQPSSNGDTQLDNNKEEPSSNVSQEPPLLFDEEEEDEADEERSWRR